MSSIPGILKESQCIGSIVATLGGFIQAEMRRRDMGMREFAAFVGVSHPTIARYSMHGIAHEYAGRPVGDPDLDFLDKLAKATHTDICSLVALVKPDSARISPLVRLIAERIENLPPADREFLDTYIEGLAVKYRGRKQNTE